MSIKVQVMNSCFIKVFKVVVFILLCQASYSQKIKVAILEFENISGKNEYDFLGKALSNMMITDLKNNIHPNKAEFYERTQLNKLLKEQNLQKGKDFDVNTSVRFGKIIGVNYVFLGSVFVSGKKCNISAKLVSVETSRILLTRDVAGGFDSLLYLKKRLASLLSKEINNPVSFTDVNVSNTASASAIMQYAKVLDLVDEGAYDKAEVLRSAFEETNPGFDYFKELKNDIERLKERVSELEIASAILAGTFELGYKAEMIGDNANALRYFEKVINTNGSSEYRNNQLLYSYIKLAEESVKKRDYKTVLDFSSKATEIYPYSPLANQMKLLALIKLKDSVSANSQYNFIVDSLTFRNEYKFKEESNNLIWEDVFEPERDENVTGLRGTSDEKIICYFGIRHYGYGVMAKNETTINQYLQRNSVRFVGLKNQKSRFEKIQDALLAFNDDEVFSDYTMLSYYRLGLTYLDELFLSKDFKKYGQVIEQELSRISRFGVYKKNNGLPSNSFKYFGKLSQYGLDNSLMEFHQLLPMVYGEYQLNYLKFLIFQHDIKKATGIYASFFTPGEENPEHYVISDDNSYFNNYYWEYILALQKAELYWTKKAVYLNRDKFKKALDSKLLKEFKQINVPEASIIQFFELTANTGKK